MILRRKEDELGCFLLSAQRQYHCAPTQAAGAHTLARLSWRPIGPLECKYDYN